MTLSKICCAALLLLAGGLAQAETDTKILAKQSFLGVEFQDKKSLSVYTSAPLNLVKPLWVSYSLVAVSPESKPRGDIVIEAMPEGVPVPLGSAFLHFSAAQMRTMPTTDNLGNAIRQKVGNRTPEELKKAFGIPMYQAYEALVNHKGSIIGQTIVKEYGLPKSDPVKMLVSLERVDGIQPLMIEIVIGQGEIPDRHRDGFAEVKTKSRDHSKLWISAGILLGGVVLFLLMRRRD